MRRVRGDGRLRSLVVMGALVLVTMGCMWEVAAPPGFEPTAINDSGTMVGQVPDETGSGRRAVKVLPNGSVVTLPVPPGTGMQTFATAINDSGTVTGYASNGAPGPVVWADDGSMKTSADITNPPSGSALAVPTDINASGVVSGVYVVLPNRFRPFVWPPPYDRIEELPVPAGYAGAVPLALNRDGVVVGVGIMSDGGSRALRWQLGSPTTVEVLSPDLADVASAGAVDVDERGVIVGRTSPSNVVTWSPGTTTAVPLPVPPGVIADSSWLVDGSGRTLINDRGTIVVTATRPDGTMRPYRSDEGGAWEELAPGASEQTVVITGFNDHGTGVGTAATADSKRPVTFT